ncbi:DUF429 domain-containing protein [Rohdeia mirabilis]|uniref:DUF429 domain-containing protein n=1 Tax=Rohdeia mirabilis TaxID=2528008 RepID=UPI003AF38DC4
MSGAARGEWRGARVGVGVDGCRGGWCGFALRATGFDGERFTEARLAGACESDLERLVGALGAPPRARLCLDMPIGLPDGTATRACDDAARRALGPRRSSLFAAPPRAVLHEVEHAVANVIARRASGRGLSLQSFHLLPKVRAVDVWMRGSSAVADRAVDRAVECHPELAFARLRGAPMDEPKRTPGGRAARLELLERLVPGARDATEELLARHRRSELAHDDVADALVLAVVAALPERAVESLGEVDGAIPVDATGLAMRILAPRVDWRERATRPARSPE